MKKEKSDLSLKVSGGCSISGKELSKDLRQFFKERGFKNIAVKGLTDKNKHGWDGLTECDTVEMTFDLKI